MMIHFVSVFFFNSPATSEIYTLSLHDALPILGHDAGEPSVGVNWKSPNSATGVTNFQSDLQTLFIKFDDSCPSDRKSTRLNSSHRTISYAVFCLKKKK